MRERLAAIGESIKNFWGNLSAKAKVVLITGTTAVLALIVVLVVILNQTQYVLLYNDLSTADRAKALSVLATMGVDTQVEPSGAILVPEEDYNRAHMQLATEGFQDGSMTSEIAAPGLTATQTDKQRYDKEKLQERLSATIETFPEVDRAVVTISMPEKSAFALSTDVTPPSASVTITRRQGMSLSTEQIQGIINVVRDSIPGIAEEDISLTDTQTGDMRKQLIGDVDVNNAKLKLTEEVNSTLRNRVLSMVQPLYGEENVEVAVNSVLDTDSRSQETIRYNPYDEENPQYHPYDYTEHDRQKIAPDGELAGGVPGANDNIGTPEYLERDQELANAASYSSHDIYDYLVGSTKEQIVKEGLDIVDTTVAVVINRQSLPDGERDRVAAIVANATGIPAELITEKVTVQNFEFEKAEVPVPGEIIPGIDTRTIIMIAAIIALLLIIIAIIIITIVSRRRRLAEANAQEEDEDEYDDYYDDEYDDEYDEDVLFDEEGQPLLDVVEETAEEEQEQIPAFEPIQLQESPEQKLRAQIKDLADTDPEIVAQLIKTWLVSE